MMDQAPLLSVSDLSITFRQQNETVEAVRGISFELFPGETLAIVGESGSGKSVTALSITQLLPKKPKCVIAGSIRYKEQEVNALAGKELRKIRGKEIAYIFQEPSASLNPVFTVGEQIAEAIRLHKPEVRDVKSMVVDLLDKVGIRRPAQRANAYPHEMSGGMQQRVMIAMALACSPQILIADEPTTALDVTIQKQIIDLLGELKQERNFSILLITHNFGLLKKFADRVLVMHKGEIVEQGLVESILEHPKHPYTKALIQCIPVIGMPKHRLPTINTIYEAESKQ